MSPPVVVKMQHAVSQAAQSTPNPTSSAITTAPTQGHYYHQQGYKLKGMTGKDPSSMTQEMGTQHLAMGQQILSTNQLVQNTQTVYPHGMPIHNQSMQGAHGMIPAQSAPPHTQVLAPAHGQVIAPHEQISVGLDQGQYAYGIGQPQQLQQQQQQQQQQHNLHTYTPTQMQQSTQWQTQQQGMSTGWMK